MDKTNDFDKKLLITEVPNQDIFDVDDDSDLDSDLSEEAEDASDQSQYFHVVDAVPPENFEDPYSTLPSKIKLSTIKVSFNLS
jgi:hypothetical protein